MSGAWSALPETLTAGVGFGDTARSLPGSLTVAGVMPSVAGGAGPSIAAGVGPIALFESSVVVASVTLFPSEAGVAPNGDCANVAPPHALASRAVNDVVSSKTVVLMPCDYASRGPLETRKIKLICDLETTEDPAFLSH
jgi:hypothetical protein